MKRSDIESIGRAAMAVCLFGISVTGGYRLISYLDGVFAWSTPPGAGIGMDGDWYLDGPVYFSDGERISKRPQPEPAPQVKEEESVTVVALAPAPEVESEKTSQPIVGDVTMASSPPEREEPVESVTSAPFTVASRTPKVTDLFKSRPEENLPETPLVVETPPAIDRPSVRPPVREVPTPSESPSESETSTPGVTSPSLLDVAVNTPVARARIDAKVGDPIKVAARVGNLPLVPAEIAAEVSVDVGKVTGGLGETVNRVTSLVGSSTSSTQAPPAPRTAPPIVAGVTSTLPKLLNRTPVKTVTLRNTLASPKSHYDRALGGSVSGLIGGLSAPSGSSAVAFNPIEPFVGLTHSTLSVGLPNADLRNATLPRASLNRGAGGVRAPNAAVTRGSSLPVLPQVRTSAITAPVRNLLPQVGLGSAQSPGIGIGIGGLNIRVNPGISLR